MAPILGVMTVMGAQSRFDPGRRTASIAAPLSPADVGAAYDRNHRDLFQYFVRQTHDLEQAADLLQITFERMWTARAAYRGHTENELRAWLRAIALSVVHEYRTKESSQQRAESQLERQRIAFTDREIERLEDLDATQAFRDAVARGLRQLPDEIREAVRLRIVEGMSYSEVAHETATTTTNARQRVSRGLRQLHAWLILEDDYADWLKGDL